MQSRPNSCASTIRIAVGRYTWGLPFDGLFLLASVNTINHCPSPVAIVEVATLCGQSTCHVGTQRWCCGLDVSAYAHKGRESWAEV